MSVIDLRQWRWEKASAELRKTEAAIMKLPPNEQTAAWLYFILIKQRKTKEIFND